MEKHKQRAPRAVLIFLIPMEITIATTSYGTNNAMAVKLWSKRLNVEVLKATEINKFIGSSQGSIIQVKDELGKTAGDKVSFGLRMQMVGDGIQGDSTLEGNEEALVTYTDALYLDQLRHATRSAGKMSEQRVPFNVREEGMQGLTDWWSDRIDTSGFNVLCGNTAQTDVRYTGLQATTAPDSSHQIWVNANEASDQSISTTSTFVLSLLDKAVERARTLTPAIRPVKVDGKSVFVAFLHPYAVTDLRTSTSTGQWLDITKAAMSGGEVDDNPIYSGSLGSYNGVVLHMASRLPLGVNSSTSAAVASTRRNVFLGAQAGVIAYGRDGGAERYSWIEKLFNYDNELGVAAGLIWGMKKTVFNSLDYASIVLSSYAAQH